MSYISAVVKDNKKHKALCINVMSILTSVQKTTVRTRLNFTFTYCTIPIVLNVYSMVNYRK